MPSRGTATIDRAARPPAGPSDRYSRYDRLLVVLFLVSLTFCNPWVRGDGVGYYAYARSLLIEKQLNFDKDWQNANESFRMGKLDASGHPLQNQYTPTGHLMNHFSIGPAILWAPFLVVTHVGVLLCDVLGAHVAADGFSKPYTVSMAMATAIYGFLALWISFQLARRYVAVRWAFMATIGMWFASSLPVYMYLNPSWSHTHSAFVVALFLWYWEKTRNERTRLQWILLGLIAGLMMDVYYVNAVVLILPLLESLGHYQKTLFSRRARECVSLFLSNLMFLCAALVAFLPTLISKKIIYGSYFDFGYTERWDWTSPALLKVAFSAEHGLFSWTPIVVLALVGLFLLAKRARTLAVYSLVTFAVYLYVIGCYQDWHGIASFGNRVFISLTAFFVLGLASFFDWLASTWNERRAWVAATAATALLILWNLGMMYQWGTHLIPPRGPISWRDAAHNQFAVVPGQAARTFEKYLFRRSQLMRQIEQTDVKDLKSRQPD